MKDRVGILIFRLDLTEKGRKSHHTLHNKNPFTGNQLPEPGRYFSLNLQVTLYQLFFLIILMIPLQIFNTNPNMLGFVFIPIISIFAFQ